MINGIFLSTNYDEVENQGGIFPGKIPKNENEPGVETHRSAFSWGGTPA